MANDGFTPEEKAAMRERAREAKASGDRSEGERALLEKVEEMDDADRALAERLHAVVQAVAPELAPRTWYGMPAYATPGKKGKVVLFFQAAAKFKARYATLGFSDQAGLDDGDLWPTSFALAAWTDDVEARVAELVRRAVG